MTPTEYNPILEEMAKQARVPLLGFADLAPARSFIEEVYGEEAASFPRAVVAGLPFPRRLVDRLQEAPSREYLHFYEVLNRSLDGLALQMANQLEADNWAALPVPASLRVSEDRLAGGFSHRLAARLAGLGWIGKSSSLIHPRYGPRIRLVSVLTDAPLETGAPVPSRCGSCRACEEACPAGAITGKGFSPEVPLEERFDGTLCDIYLSKVRSAFGQRVCGRCLAVCPHGKG